VERSRKQQNRSEEKQVTVEQLWRGAGINKTGVKRSR